MMSILRFGMEGSRARTHSRSMVRSSGSQLSTASTTMNREDEGDKLRNGSIIILSNCWRKLKRAAGDLVMAALMVGAMDGSCIAISFAKVRQKWVVTDVALELGEKKKRAAKRLACSHSSAIVAAIVVFPVPAASFSQKIGLSLTALFAQTRIASNILVRVPSSQRSKSRPYDIRRKESAVPSVYCQRCLIFENLWLTVGLFTRYRP